jgi:hypothetical protein
MDTQDFDIAVADNQNLLSPERRKALQFYYKTLAKVIGRGLSVVRTKSWGLLKESSRSKWILPYLALVAVLVWGAVRGFVLHQPFLVVDANAWGFLLLLLPASYLWQQSPVQLKADVRSMLPAALGTLTVLTLGLFVLFSQLLVDFGPILDTVYAWIRRSGLGEITDIGRGNVHRIFLASQIALLPPCIAEHFSADPRSTCNLFPFLERQLTPMSNWSLNW